MRSVVSLRWVVILALLLAIIAESQLAAGPGSDSVARAGAPGEPGPIAEGRPVDADQLPEGDTPEADQVLPRQYPDAKPELLQPGSLVFRKTRGPVPLSDWGRWWEYRLGADWRHPYGPGSSIEGLDDDPVVHVTFADALAPGGFLVLGKVKTLFGPARQQLTLLAPRERVYRRAA